MSFSSCINIYYCMRSERSPDLYTKLAPVFIHTDAGFSTITALMSRHHSTRYNSSTEVFLMWRYPIPCFCITTLHYLLYI
ncbi:hypothetical protein O3G_MSEX000781 [Manduca sexta]|nr:hypothetical protein O3G_MSEX000781 [Manduca sexta]KAG6439448.1 hypothetical protein O3G_MSEX000781 [Manduca sexta]KAG6439449.1 hypothetical protein O3G_MSEX000781 [Manduca sexta]